MSVSQMQQGGRLIAYSPEIDDIFLKNQQKVDSFKERKITELLQENPFNLETPSGIKLAQEKISEQIKNEISELAAEFFLKLRMDIASSVLVGYVQKK